MFNNDIEHNVNCMIFLNCLLNDKYKGKHKERRVGGKKEHMREDTKMRTNEWNNTHYEQYDWSRAILSVHKDIYHFSFNVFCVYLCIFLIVVRVANRLKYLLHCNVIRPISSSTNCLKMQIYPDILHSQNMNLEQKLAQHHTMQVPISQVPQFQWYHFARFVRR